MISKQAIYLCGIVFLMIAAVLTVKQLFDMFSYLDLMAGFGWLLCGLIVITALSSQLLTDLAKAATLIVFSVFGMVSTVILLIQKRPDSAGDPITIGLPYYVLPYYVGTGLFFVISIYLVYSTQTTWRKFDMQRMKQLPINTEAYTVWISLIVSSLAFSWSSYFNFITPTGEAFTSRRLLFTLVYILVGVVCNVYARRSPLPFLNLMGMTYLTVGVCKAILYDT